MSTDNRFYSGDFTVAVAVSPQAFEWPFHGDDESVVYRQDFVQRFDSFERTAWDTPSPDRPDMYLVDETPLSPIGVGVGRFTRTYARVPTSRFTGTGSDEVEPYVATVPGIGYTDPITFAEYISGGVTSGATTVLTITNPPHSFEANDWVAIIYFARDPSTNIILRRQVSRLVSSVTVNHVIVSRIDDAYTIVAWEVIYKSLANRDPFQIVVPSWISREYYLPGVSPGIQSAADIPILEPTPIIDHVSGNRTDTITDQTTPSLTDYFTLISTGTKIVAEPSNVSRWMGNIWERKTRYITAV